MASHARNASRTLGASAGRADSDANVPPTFDEGHAAQEDASTSPVISFSPAKHIDGTHTAQGESRIVLLY